MGTPKQRHGGLQKMILKVKDCYINCFYPTCTLLFVSFYHRIIDTFKSLYKSIYYIVIQVYLFMYMCTSHFTYGETSNNNEILEANPHFPRAMVLSGSIPGITLCPQHSLGSCALGPTVRFEKNYANKWLKNERRRLFLLYKTKHRKKNKKWSNST